jgi:hypothetical protein
MYEWHGMAGMGWLAWDGRHGMAGIGWLAQDGWHKMAGTRCVRMMLAWRAATRYGYEFKGEK